MSPILRCWNGQCQQVPLPWPIMVSSLTGTGKAGEIHRVRDYCKKIRDAGVLVGVSTHIPEVVKHVIEEDWDVDFFMCCVYERHRTQEELLALLGHVPIPIPEVYLESDPPRMFAVMRQTEKPC